ncbi:MAG: hypothetical protein ABIN79_10250 [Marmoricola sp.]
MKTRLLIGAFGLAMGLFGALRFLQRDLDDILDSVLWLAAGVAVHDAVIAPLTLALGALASRVLPAAVRTRVVLGFVVLATMTITAIPVLGRFGAREDNATLLDRNYTVGWLTVAALIVVGTLLVARVSDRLGQRAPAHARQPEPKG